MALKQGREMDQLVAELVMGHSIIGQRKGTIKERTRQGQVRPLRAYSSDISAAWEVVQKMGIALIPIEDGSWFALVGNGKGWKSPADFIAFLQTADYVKGGAAIGETPAFAVCVAALKAVEKREAVVLSESPASGPH